MVARDVAVGAVARLAMRAAELLRAEIFGYMKGHERGAVEALERLHGATLAERRDRLIERGLQERGMNRIEHRSDVIVGRDFRHAKQRQAVGGLTPLLKKTLIGKKRFQLHQEQRKHRHADDPPPIHSIPFPLLRPPAAYSPPPPHKFTA